MIFLPDFFAEVKKIEQEMKDLLDRVHRGEETLGASPYMNLVPPVDIMEQAGTLEIVMDVPGMTIDDLQIQFTGGFLIITGRKPTPDYAESATNFVCMERNFGAFRRKIYIQRPVELDETRAELDNGILTITLVTRAERRGAPRQIPINHIAKQLVSEENE